MNTAVIITKTEPKVKKQAQAIAKELGMSLSTLINTYLRQVVRTKKVELDLGEEPSPYLVKILKQAEKNIKEGKGSPAFDNVDDALDWLHKKVA